jgi:hypothetical protein
MSVQVESRMGAVAWGLWLTPRFPSHRVAGGGRPPPAPTERGVRISRTTLFGSWFTAFTAICSSFVSMVLRVRSVSMASTRSSDPSHLFGLAGPTSLCLNGMDLPCSRCFLWLHAGGTNPGSISGPSLWRGLRFRLPLYGIGSATPITIDFNLPVYASQRPLPDATQDSVRGCSLGFAAAVIADGRLQRASKAQPAQIRACATKATVPARRSA